MKDDISLEEIPHGLRDKYRRRWLWFREDNPKTQHQFIYIPLYSRIGAKVGDESHLPEILKNPVAVYQRSDWRKREYIEYTYCRDDVR